MAVGTGGVVAAQPDTAADTARAVSALAEPKPPVSYENIANPERGFFSGPGDCNTAFNEAKLRQARRDLKITLVRCIFYLDEYKNGPLGAAVVGTDGTGGMLRQQAATVERLGLKMVLRFAYTQSDEGDDVPVTRVEQHLEQLKPILQEKAHVIHVMESGFVGAYGEGYNTQNFGAPGEITATDWANRKRVVDKVLAVLPPDRKTQVRTVDMKRDWYGKALSEAGTSARVGVNNDCFLGTYKDQGTYADKIAHNYSGTYGAETNESFLDQDSKFAVVGGELCGETDMTPIGTTGQTRGDCPNALTELSKYSWTHLNKDWDDPHISEAVLPRWAVQGCRDDVDRRLGYRLELAGTAFPTTVQRGRSFVAQVNIHNSGWAAPISHRPVQLGVRKVATKAVSYIPFRDAKPRTWQPGTTVTLSAPVTLYSAGDYEFFLRLPDASPALQTSKAMDPLDPQATAWPYNIQLATPNVWDRYAGHNKLQRVVRVF